MVIELTLGNAITVVALFVAALWALVKVISTQQDRRLSERFKTLGESMRGIAEAQSSNAEATRLLERDFLRWQAELPLQYVRREDYIRGQSVVEAKLDAIASKVEAAQLRALQGGKDAH